MNWIIVSVCGGTASHCAVVVARYDESGGKICGRFAKDLIGPLQFANFAHQCLHLLGLLGGDAAGLASINFDLLDPFVQRSRRAAYLQRDLHDSRPRPSCCPMPSNPIRTALSRTSGEYQFVVFLMMHHPTHELKPLANPVRSNTSSVRFSSGSSDI